MAKRKPQRVVKNAGAISAVFALAVLLLLILLYYNSALLGLPASIVIAFVALFCSGLIIQKLNGLPGAIGLYVFGGRTGISTIESIARNHSGLWKTITELGLVMSFGLLSWFIFRKQIRPRVFVLGIVLILILLFVIYPYTVLVLQFIKAPNISAFAGAQPSPFQISPVGYLLYGVTLVGGFSFFMVALLFVGAGSLVAGLLSVVATAPAGMTSNAVIGALSTQVPGLEPVIPGLTIPLLAGLLALAVILVAHEFSHGIAATMYKTKVKKVGLVMFGIIPVGAFVEPDEKKMRKLSPEKQNKILVAGVSANFLLTFVFFALTFLMLTFVVPGLYQTHVVIYSTVPGSPAANVVATPAFLLSWNGYPISNLTALEQVAVQDAPNTSVTLSTSTGNYTVIANATGKIGVNLDEENVTSKISYSNSFLEFLYQFFVLAFALNLIVAIINLLPLPSFDGWQIYKNLIADRRKLHAAGLIILLLLFILALPWLPWALNI